MLKFPVLNKEGKHYIFDDLEFWAENGLIYIEDKRKDEFNVVTCRDFVYRAKAINDEIKRSIYTSDTRHLQDCVLKMHEVWKEAKSQGDPTDVEIAKKKYKERRRAIMTTGIW